MRTMMKEECWRSYVLMTWILYWFIGIHVGFMVSRSSEFCDDVEIKWGKSRKENGAVTMDSYKIILGVDNEDTFMCSVWLGKYLLLIEKFMIFV